MDSATQWLSFAVVLMMMMWGLRWHYGRRTKGRMLYLGVTKVGNPDWKLLQEKDGLLELPAESGKGEKTSGVLGPGGGKRYPVAEIASISVGYPLGLFRFLQVPVKMAIFNEWNWEPMSNRGENPLMSPRLLDNILYEAKSGGWVAGTEAIEEQQEIIRKLTMRQQLKPALVYTGILLLIAAVGGIYYLAPPFIEQIAENSDKMGEMLDKLNTIGAGQGLW